jgi:hypothetical protein
VYTVVGSSPARAGASQPAASNAANESIHPGRRFDIGGSLWRQLRHHAAGGAVDHGRRRAGKGRAAGVVSCARRFAGNVFTAG